MTNLGKERLELSGGCEDEAEVRRGRPHGPRNVFRVVLDGDIELVVVQLHDLHPTVLGVVADELHSGGLELVHEVGVDLVPVSVTFLDRIL